MKKFPAIIALVMTLVMLAIPMGAMAETTTANVIQIANPTLSVDDDSRSMPGLALQLAMCESADASLVQLIADVLVNNQNANSAMLQIDSLGNIVGLLGGMSNAYTVNMNEASTVAEGAYAHLATQVEEIFYSLESWTLPDEIMTIIQTHAANFTITDKGVSTNANGVEMQYVGIQGDITDMIIDIMRAIENDETIMTLIQTLDPYTTSLELVEGSGIGNGNGFRVDATVGTDAYGMVIDCTADMVIYTDNVDTATIRIDLDSDASDAVNTVCNFAASMLDPEGAVMFDSSVVMNTNANGWVLNSTANVDDEVVTMNAVYNTTDTIDTFTLNAIESEDDQITITYTNEKTGETSGKINAEFRAVEYGDESSATFNATYALTDTGITVNGKVVFSDPYAGETVISLNDLTIDAAAGILNFDFSTSDPYAGETSAVLNGSYTATDSGMIINGALTLTDSYGDVTALKLDELSYNSLTGDFLFSVSYEDVYTDPSNFTVSLTSCEPAEGANYSGLLAISMFDGYSTFGVTADIHTLTVPVDTANFYVDPITAINVLSMTGDQMAAAEAEFGAIMEDLVNTIVGAYPSIFE